MGLPAYRTGRWRHAAANGCLNDVMDQLPLPAADAMTPQLLQAFEQSDEAIVVVDPGARVVVANRCARVLFSDDGLIGRDARQLLPAALLAVPADAVAGATAAATAAAFPHA